MRKQLLTLSILALLVFGFTSCEKDKDDTPEKTNTELLSQGSWELQSATWSGQDALTFIDDCKEDNVITANADGSGNIDESAEVCNPSEAGPFTWTFENSETELDISAVLVPGGATTFDIITLNETTLVISQDFTFGPVTAPVILTFVH
jgi:hypothetical protein